MPGCPVSLLAGTNADKRALGTILGTEGESRNRAGGQSPRPHSCLRAVGLATRNRGVKSKFLKIGKAERLQTIVDSPNHQSNGALGAWSPVPSKDINHHRTIR
jgi:hypothetical protein